MEGEGVDDYGGPYREVFAHVAGELQAPFAGQRGDSDEALALPLLLPTPNQSVGLGAERSLYVLNPRPLGYNTASLPGAMPSSLVTAYSFLGQMIGMAVR